MLHSYRRLKYEAHDEKTALELTVNELDGTTVMKELPVILIDGIFGLPIMVTESESVAVPPMKFVRVKVNV